MDLVKNLIVEIEQLKAEKKFDIALQKLENSLSNYNDDYRIYEEIADIYLYLGKNTKALKAIDFALNINKDSATGNYLKGFLLLTSNKVVEAVELLEKSNSIMPNNSEVLRNLGWGYSVIGNYEKGIFILKRALNLAPNDRLITEDLAMALIGSGKIKEGNILLEKIGKNKILI
ncbi:hypothetical protein H3C61_02190 [Candidatus Gracilibacteria bacterium]|nr:hypothetical protein [Candidatus Gracilibacteria bacterium]